MVHLQVVLHILNNPQSPPITYSHDTPLIATNESTHDTNDLARTLRQAGLSTGGGAQHGGAAAAKHDCLRVGEHGGAAQRVVGTGRV